MARIRRPSYVVLGRYNGHVLITQVVAASVSEAIILAKEDWTGLDPSQVVIQYVGQGRLGANELNLFDVSEENDEHIRNDDLSDSVSTSA
jgi:hypothetical protein